MATDQLQAWVECLSRRRYRDLATAVWDLLWLAAQHQSFGVRLKPGIGLEFLLDDEETRVYPLGDSVGWLRAILARMGSLLKDHGAVTSATGHYGFRARIRMPDEGGVDRSFEIETKNSPRGGMSLAVRQSDPSAQPSASLDSAAASGAE